MAVASQQARLDSRYWRVWSASAISNLGDGVDAAALPLLAATLTRDPRLVAGLTTAAFLPWLLFALVAGALVDRLDRRRVMVTVNLVRGALVALIAVLAGTGMATIWALYVVAFVLGINETLFDNAAQSVLPAIVAPALLERANGRQYAAEVIANSFAGPPLGGVLFAAAVAAPFGLDAASFVLSAALIFTVRGSYRAVGANDAAGVAAPARRSLRAEMGEGVRWLRRHRLLRTLALLLGTMNLASNLGFATFVLFAEEKLGLGDRGYGVLLAAAAVGSVVGGLVGSRLGAALGARRALTGCILVEGLTLVGIGVSSSPVAVVGLMWASGLSAVVWNVITVSLRQRIIPDHLLGRVNSVYRFLGWGAIPVGALVGGFLAGAFGLRTPWLVAGALTIAASLVALPVLRSADAVAIAARTPEPAPAAPGS